MAELAFLRFGPRKTVRALCATTDRRGLPSQTTWYLSSNLKGSSREEITQLHAWRNWTEQGYKYVKGELGWADFQVRGDTAIAGTGRLSVRPSASAGGKPRATDA